MVPAWAAFHVSVECCPCTTVDGDHDIVQLPPLAGETVTLAEHCVTLPVGYVARRTYNVVWEGEKSLLPLGTETDTPSGPI